MAIVLRKPGEAALAAGAGQAIGEAQKKMQEREEAQALAAEQRARQWELQKAEMNSQLDFQQQQLTQQFQIEAEKRARMWELEKAELASRADFAREEAKRQRELSDKDNKMTAVKKAFESGQITKQQYDALSFNIQYDIPYSSVYQESEPTTLTPDEQAKAERIKAGLLPRAEQEDGGIRTGVYPSYYAGATPAEIEALNAKARMEALNPPVKIGSSPYWARPEMVGTPIFKAELVAKGVYWDELTDAEKDAQLKALGISKVAPAQQIPTVSSDAEFDALPSGAEFLDPQGNRRRKP